MVPMATILPNDNAPAESVKYILPTATFDLAGGGTYETDDRAALSDAEAHPWLKVEYPALEELAAEYVSKSVPYEDDPLAAPNSKAFDPDLIRADQEARVEAADAPLAIESGLDQGKAETDGEVAVTLAATDEKPRKSSGKGD